jgi:predicted DNA-binding protein with PD1-like motif
MVTQSAEIKRVVMVRLNPGDDILEGLNKAVEKEEIQSGIILNGLGSAQSYRYHVVADNELPPLEAFPAGRAARDIVSFSGLISRGRVHAHITFSDQEKAEGGHLEPGTEALTFAIIYIADLGDEDVEGWDKIQVMEN